jgi:hypothetical protein
MLKMRHICFVYLTGMYVYPVLLNALQWCINWCSCCKHIVISTAESPCCKERFPVLHRQACVIENKLFVYGSEEIRQMKPAVSVIFLAHYWSALKKYICVQFQTKNTLSYVQVHNGKIKRWTTRTSTQTLSVTSPAPARNFGACWQRQRFCRIPMRLSPPKRGAIRM